MGIFSQEECNKIFSSCHCGPPINLSMDKETLLDTCRVLKPILITVTIMKLLDA